MRKMKQVVALAVSALAVSALCAKELNGNLDYDIRSDKGRVVLELSNKRADTAATLVSVRVLAPGAKMQGSEGRRAVNGAIAPRLTVDLGSVGELARLMASQADLKRYPSVSAGVSPIECPGDACRSIGFPIELELQYQKGLKQTVLQTVFLNLSSA